MVQTHQLPVTSLDFAAAAFDDVDDDGVFHQIWFVRDHDVLFLYNNNNIINNKIPRDPRYLGLKK